MNLGPLREQLLAQARSQAASVAGAARREAEAKRAEARSEAAALLGQAAAERAAAASAARARRLLRAQRQAHALILGAQRQAYEELRASAHAAARDLRARPEYADLQHRLAAAARAQLGPDAELFEPGSGGLEARAGGRLIDCSLPAMVERCLAGLGGDLEELWR